MKDLFEITPVDREFYESRLVDFLPDRIIDIHAHVWQADHAASDALEAARAATWPQRVATANPIEDLLASYELLLPGKLVRPLIFSNPLELQPPESLNPYATYAAAQHGLPALGLTSPCWDAETFERAIVAGGFCGAKPYLTYAPATMSSSQISIFDFIPPHQLAALDRHGWVLMLHIPRPGRLGDPENLSQLLEIEQRYPGIKVIVAHVGRAYCPEDLGDAFDILAGTQRMCFDISANTNELVFGELLQAVGPRRVLFGSDLPITRMRMMRICKGGRYVNLVPKGLYGDVSGDSHMQELAGPAAEGLTFFLYEQIDAFRRATEAQGLTSDQVADIFCSNAAKLLDEARCG